MKTVLTAICFICLLSLTAHAQTFSSNSMGAMRQALSKKQSSSCTTAPAGLIGWWKAEGDANDIIGGNNGNWTTFAAGKVGQAFSFNGSGGILLPSTPALNPTEAITLSSWVNPSSYPNDYPTIIRKQTDGGNSVQYLIALDNLNKTGQAHANINNIVTLSGGSVPLNQWSHVAFSYDRQTAVLYVNGIAVASGNFTTPILTANTSLGIGTTDFPDREFNGLIDEASIYSRALSQAEIQAEFNAGSAGKCQQPTVPDTLTPVIFIPGISGSRLNIKGTPIELWLGTGTPHDSLSLDPALTPCPPLIPFYDSCYRPDVDVDGVIREAVPLFKKAQFYKPILDMFRREGYTEEGTNPTLFVFAYDWRKSNTDNAIKLKELVTHVRSIHQNSKVSIVTHSMGGLLARTYILDNPAPDLHHVDKLITIAAPWLGSPKTLLTLETGQNFEGLSQILIRRNTLKTLVDFYPSVHELMPSPAYFNLGGFPFAEDEWDINGNGITYENYNAAQMYSLFNNRHQRSLPSYASLIFHNRTGQDDWRNRGFGVDYYHLYGWKPRSETIHQVVAKRGVRCTPSGFGLDCDGPYIFQPKLGPGDGTVPILSATRTTPSGSQNYNAEKRVIKRFIGANTEHLKLTHNPDVHQEIILSLNAPPLSLTEKVNQKDNANRLNQLDEPITQQAYYLQVGGTTSATLTDEAGDLTYPLGDIPDAGVPEVTSYLLGQDTFLSIMPTDDSFKLTFVTGESPVVINLTKGTHVETAQAIRYLDLDLPANTNVQLVITPEGVGELRYDSDGNGTFESTVQPTASMSGEAAQDTQAPTIGVNEVPLAMMRRVTITATDEGAGVRSVFYSLDGTNFQPYNGAFEINPTQTTTVYVFAEDNVANRSSLVTYSVKKRRKGRVRRGSRDGF